QDLGLDQGWAGPFGLLGREVSLVDGILVQPLRNSAAHLQADDQGRYPEYKLLPHMLAPHTSALACKTYEGACLFPSIASGHRSLCPYPSDTQRVPLAQHAAACDSRQCHWGSLTVTLPRAGHKP